MSRADKLIKDAKLESKWYMRLFFYDPYESASYRCAKIYIQAGHALKLEGRYLEAAQAFLKAAKKASGYSMRLKIEALLEAYNIFIIHDVPQAIICLKELINSYLAVNDYNDVYKHKYLLAQAYQKNNDTCNAIEAYNDILVLAKTTPYLKMYEDFCMKQLGILRGVTPC